MPDIAKGVGEPGAQIRLSGTGNSIADAAASADGSVTAAITNGRISNLMDGIGQSQLMVVDTEQTRIDGSGTFSLKDELFDITVAPKPKKPGILSLRTPVHLFGSFRHPEFGLDKGRLILRAGAATALALINPLAALLPLIETGPGKDSDCARVLAPVQGAQQQATATGNAQPKAAPGQKIPRSAAKK